MSHILDEVIIDDDNAPDTKVKASFTDGWGLFAGRNFKEGETIITSAENKDLFTKFSYINHSQKPNCVWDVEARLVIAAKNITEGDELFIDYRLNPNISESSSWL
jgi:hypothetical protein